MRLSTVEARTPLVPFMTSVAGRLHRPCRGWWRRQRVRQSASRGAAHAAAIRVDGGGADSRSLDGDGDGDSGWAMAMAMTIAAGRWRRGDGDGGDGGDGRGGDGGCGNDRAVRVGEEQDQHADAAEVRGQERLPCSSAGTHLVTRKVVQVALTKGAARTVRCTHCSRLSARQRRCWAVGHAPMRRLACCACRLKRQHGADGLKGGWVAKRAVARLQATALGHGGVPAVAVCTRRRPWLRAEVKA